MKPKTLVLLAVAAGCGLVAMLGIQQAMQGGQGGASPKVKVLVAREDIQPGIQLTDDLVGFQEMSVEAVPEDPVTSFEEYEERSLIYPMMKGDIIRQTKLGKKGEFTRSRQIPEGKRVVGISVNDTQTISGMLRPGDRVDVLVTYQVRSMRGRMTTKNATLLKYIEVFGTDNKTVSDGASKQQEVKTKVVSLLLEPEQANILMLAQSKGTLALSWRHPDDDEDVEGGIVDETLLTELRGLDNMDDNGPPTLSRRGPALFDEDSTAGGKPVAEPKDDLNSLLDEGDQQLEEPKPAVVVAEAPKPTWSITIYQGNNPVEQQFELPAPEQGATSEAGAGGDESLTEAFKWLHEQFTEGEEAPAETESATETSL